MRLMLLAGGKKGTHTVKWANGLAKKGVDVHLVTQQDIHFPLDAGVSLYKLPFKGSKGYYLNVLHLRKLIFEVKPDIVNAHYASGYGTLARLSKAQPLLLSVWGSDVYDFPDRNFLCDRILRKNLNNADAVASTSASMATYTQDRFSVEPPIYITPFGVDTDFFSPKNEFELSKTKIVIGTVKTLSDKYGIDTLIRAFHLVTELIGDSFSLRLEITGDGPERAQLERLAKDLGVLDKIVFHGFLDKQGVVEKINEMDVYVALSRLDSESFGVAILEALSCEKPVVVSDVSGPAEVVNDGVTGFVVPRDNHRAAADKIIYLIENPIKRKEMGTQGRQHVCNSYSWENSLLKMLEVYEKTVRGER